MERALPSIFDSDRNTGVMFQNAPCDKRMTWALGIFADTDGGGEFFTSDTNFNVTGRMTGLPLYQDDGRQLIHLGVSAGYRFEDHIERRFRQRPEVHLAQRYLDTGTFVADGSTLLSAEAAGVFGPLHVSGEWKQVWIDGSGMRNTTGYGGYAQAGYFLTGEHRAYKKSAAAWGRTKPNNPFDPKNDKWGAFEIAGRYSYLNLNSADLDGGKEQNATFGANWYLFSNVRLSMNYVYANVRSTGAQLGLEGGDIHTFQARAQLEF
jgi:phosphate-selective porin OprO/OprP